MASLDALQTLAEFQQELLARVVAAQQALSQPAPQPRRAAQRALEEFRDYPALPSDSLREQAKTAIGAMQLANIGQALAGLQQLQQQLAPPAGRLGLTRRAKQPATPRLARVAARKVPPVVRSRRAAAGGGDPFSEDPQATWLTTPDDADDRRMKLLRDFWFRDPDGKIWLAPTNSIVDGASIPAPLWSIVGSPYTGHYRRASIVHDVACAAAKKAPDPVAARAAADRMFYQACLAGGCPPEQAELLYLGVRLGAWCDRIPLWSKLSRLPRLAISRILPSVAEQSLCAAYYEIATYIQANAPATLSELAALVETHLAAKAAQPLLALPAPKRQLARRPPLR